MLSLPADFGAQWAAAWHALLAPLQATDWSAWHDFWLKQIFDDRFLVCWFAPLLPILLLLRGDRLRIGIVLTGLAFVAFVFGALYAGFWVLICLLLYAAGERYAWECANPRVTRISPSAAVIFVIVGGFFGSQLIQHIPLPEVLNEWLHTHAAWLFPLGARGWAWEPALFSIAGPNPPLLGVAFFDAHLIGTAYLAMRMLHYFSEIHAGTILAERRTPLNFLAYCCYAPTLMQGPLGRYAPFQDEMDTCHTRRSLWNLPPATVRIAWGLAKVLFTTLYVSPFLYERMGLGQGNTYYKHPEQIASTWILYTGAFVHIWALYLEFSGYCDIAAGFSRLLGYRLIENFDRPWAATSLRDFWRRWHISLSLILRDYLYIPLGGNRRHTVFNLCLTFFLCGIWHPTIVKAGLWGILMGLLLAGNQAWAHWMKRLDEQPERPLAVFRRRWQRLRPLPWLVSWAFTMHVFVWSLLLFSGGKAIVTVPWELAKRLWAALSGG
jgi:D-alanyl-lipoteichoic acid acyltransferase DltB (MBOAT superfamily)